MASLLKTLCYSLAFCFFLVTPIYAQSTIPHIQWAKSFGGSEIDQALSIEQTADKGFIIAGLSSSADIDIEGHHGSTDTYDYWIVKLDSNGGKEWQRSLGSGGNEIAHSIKQTSDGGYIVAGSSDTTGGDISQNFGGNDYWVVKLDENGKIVWYDTYGGSSNDIANDIMVTADGGLIVAGYSSSTDGDITMHHGTDSTADYWIVKTNWLGYIQWRKSFGGNGDDIAYSIKQTSDHGYAVAGYSNSTDGDVIGNHGGEDCWIIKLDSMGTLLWQKSIGGSGVDEVYAMDETPDDGFILAGYSNSNDGDVSGNHGQTDYWVVKLDSVGNLKWQKSFGGSESDASLSVRSTFDGGFILAGNTVSDDNDVTGNHGGNDYWIVKLDSLGNLQWQKTLGGPGEDFALCVRQTTDSGYVIAGSSDFDGGDVSGNHNHEDFWIVKLGIQEKNGVVFSDRDKFKTGSNYPNPFINKTIISLSEIARSGSSLHLYNQLGQQIRTMNIPEGSKNILLERSGLPDGMYVYHIMRNGKIIERGRIVAE